MARVGELHTLDLELERIARRQPGCRALMGHYGIGPLVATAILGDEAIDKVSTHRYQQTLQREWAYALEYAADG